MLYDLLETLTNKKMIDYLMADVSHVKEETVYYALPGYNKKDIVYNIRDNKVVLKTVEDYEEKPHRPKLNALAIAYVPNNYDIKDLKLEDGLLTIEFEPKKEDLEFLQIK